MVGTEEVASSTVFAMSPEVEVVAKRRSQRMVVFVVLVMLAVEMRNRPS